MSESWLFWVGIVLLVLYLPLTVVSYLKYRLPEKEEEYRKLMIRLKEKGIEDPETISVLEEKYKWGDYMFPLFFASLFCFMGFWVLFANNADILLAGLGVGGVEDYAYSRGSLVAIGMAFLGAYVWSVQYIFRRLVTVDLPPGGYYNVGTRMVFASFVALVFYHFIRALPSGEFNVSGMEADVVPDRMLYTMVPVVAFIAGTFPQRALQYMVERFKFAAIKKDKRAAELPLDMLEGVNAFHKVRLSELGIDNIQNLVEASLVELIVRTPYRPRQLVDWMAQGRLILHFKDNTRKLQGAGVRTILGFRRIGESEKLKELASISGLNPVYLEIVYKMIQDSEPIERLAKAESCLHAV
jgi:hypothetical protein